DDSNKKFHNVKSCSKNQEWKPQIVIPYHDLSYLVMRWESKTVQPLPSNHGQNLRAVIVNQDHDPLEGTTSRGEAH
ncbi:hypothetical protein HAX54_002600, partial [Datura stramonium]|nr:hypothetical protein [Datura stramonium]